MIDEFIHWPTPYLLLSRACDEILEWMIEFWMENHMGSNIDYNIVNPYPPPKKKVQGMTNNVGLKFSVGDTIPQFTISI